MAINDPSVVRPEIGFGDLVLLRGGPRGSLGQVESDVLLGSPTGPYHHPPWISSPATRRGWRFYFRSCRCWQLIMAEINTAGDIPWHGRPLPATIRIHFEYRRSPRHEPAS